MLYYSDVVLFFLFSDMVRGRTTRGHTSRGRGQPSNDEVVSRPTRNFSKGIPQPSTPFHGRILDCG